MLDRIFADPAAMVSSCLLWIPIAVATLSILGWMIMGEVDVVFGLVALFTLFGVGYLALNPPAPYVPHFLLGATSLTVLGWPAFARWRRAAEFREIEVNAIESAYERLRLRPLDTASKFRVARGIYALNHQDLAVALGSAALHGVNPRFYEEDIRTLRSWQNQPGRMASNDIVCSECGHRNPPSEFFCQMCNAAHIQSYVRGEWSPKSFRMKVLSVWLVAVLLLVGIPVLTAVLPPIAAACAIVAVLGGAAFWLCRVFLPSKEPV